MACSSRQTDVNPMSHEQLARFKGMVERLVTERSFASWCRNGLGDGGGRDYGRSELMAVRPSDLDMPGRTVRIERSLDLDGEILKRRRQRKRGLST